MKEQHTKFGSLEHRILMSTTSAKYWLGKKLPPETVEKIRKANTGKRFVSYQSCIKCQKEFYARPSELKRGYGKYCSRQCCGKSENGQGNYSTDKLLRRSPQYKKWQLSIYKRDNYECQICSGKGKKLNANHIKKWSTYPALRFDTNNGILLCQDCHMGLVTANEQEWESYFNFNLTVRGII